MLVIQVPIQARNFIKTVSFLQPLSRVFPSTQEEEEKIGRQGVGVITILTLIKLHKSCCEKNKVVWWSLMWSTSPQSTKAYGDLLVAKHILSRRHTYRWAHSQSQCQNHGKKWSLSAWSLTDVAKWVFTLQAERKNIYSKKWKVTRVHVHGLLF